MYNSNLAFSISESVKIKDWDYFVSELTRIYNLSYQERERLESSKVAKIIALIPYVAKCYEPERTAIAHLCLYLAEIKGFQKYCSHNQTDDIHYMNRLRFLSNFNGGNTEVINHGMNLLAFAMIEGYKTSAKTDEKNGIYNPFVSKVWNYKRIKKEIINKLSKKYIPELDDIFYENPKMIIWL